jgi:hypothetical protein
LYFDADAQKLVWMTVGQQYEITVRGFSRLLGLENQLEMPLEAQIHTFGMLKLDEMQFMYAPGAELQARVEHYLQTSPCDLGSQDWRLLRLSSV